MGNKGIRAPAAGTGEEVMGSDKSAPVLKDINALYTLLDNRYAKKVCLLYMFLKKKGKEFQVYRLPPSPSSPSPSSSSSSSSSSFFSIISFFYSYAIIAVMIFHLH